MISEKDTLNFMRLFRGRTDAYGTGRGQWIRREPHFGVYASHLNGTGPGLGIAPLLDDGNVWFAAIDLDEPNFDKAREMQQYLPGTTFVERSRSGNAHILSFFKRPIEAWIVRGIMREAISAAEMPTVEIFPKQDKLYGTGMLGNYINLAYHGESRPVLIDNPEGRQPISLQEFLAAALATLNDPEDWRARGRWLMLESPEQRAEGRAEFGTGTELHCCAEWIIGSRDELPVREGFRNTVYFNLAKMLRHYSGFSEDEAFGMMQLVRDSSDAQGVEHVDDRELRRLFDNAAGFTSTGCDNPLMAPYRSPLCQIGK